MEDRARHMYARGRVSRIIPDADRAPMSRRMATSPARREGRGLALAEELRIDLTPAKT
jgi:hypothetical protein